MREGENHATNALKSHRQVQVEKRDLPIKRQAQLFDISRSSVYYQARLVKPDTLRKNTSARRSQHLVYPYLLRNRTVDQPNLVWTSDITFLSMAKGFVYLVAIVDRAKHKVLGWQVSNTLTADFCVVALE